MTWTRLCAAEDLPEGAARTFEVAGTSLAAARSGAAVFALENRCSHDDGALGTGHLAGAAQGEIECPRHGGRFDLATGRATRMPAAAPIRTYRAKLEEGAVWVDLPEEDA